MNQILKVISLCFVGFSLHSMSCVQRCNLVHDEQKIMTNLPKIDQRLLRAVQAGDSLTLQLLLDGGANPNVKDAYEQALLHWAVHSGSVDCVRILIESGATIDVVDHFNRRPLHHAVIYSHRDCVRILVEEGAALDVVDCHGKTPLHETALLHDTDCLDILLEAGAATDVTCKGGHTTLYSTALLGNVAALSALLKAGAFVDEPTRASKETPLHAATGAIFASTACVKMLLASGATTDVRDYLGRTPLHNAVRNRSLDSVRALHQAGADPHVQDKDWVTPLQLAEQIYSRVQLEGHTLSIKIMKTIIEELNKKYRVRNLIKSIRLMCILRCTRPRNV